MENKDADETGADVGGALAGSASLLLTYSHDKAQIWRNIQ